MRLRAPVLSSLVVAASLGTYQALRARSAPRDEVRSSAIDLLIQKVCVDPGDKVLPVDPLGCRDPDRLRPLRVGEALPYHHHDQPMPGHPLGLQQKDSYPILDLEGRVLVVNPFDYAPFAGFEPARDGYDIYRVEGGWASAGETRDAGGFSTTFFGADCRRWNGWVFFPATSRVAAGSAELPIAGRYWQQNGEIWPGGCDPSGLRPSLTSWVWLPGFAFGGVNGAPVKRLDALRSIHGTPAGPAFFARGHLKVFYFTKLYGLTRWETWSPDQQLDEQADRARQAEIARRVCGGPHRMRYRGVALTMTACRDWSAVTVAAVPEPPPPWPIPDLNLLHNFSFGEGTAGWSVSWPRGGAPVDGALRAARSQRPRDTRYLQPGGLGLGYVAIDCRAGCPSLSQTVAASARTAISRVVFATTIRSESAPGAVRLALAQLDATGKAVAETAVTAPVGTGNGRFGGDSVLLSSTFAASPGSVAVDRRARALRLTIAPVSAGRYDISDAWLMPSPPR
jgi:hypothetical protein